MKTVKIVRLLIIAIISSQGLFCTTEDPQESITPFLQSFVEKQKSKHCPLHKNFIKYDVSKDEIVVLVDKDAYGGEIKWLTKGLRITFISTFVLGFLLMLLSKDMLFLKFQKLICHKLARSPIQLQAAQALIGTGVLGLLLTESIFSKFTLTPIPDPEKIPFPLELLKFTPVGLEVCSSFIMAWKDISQSVQTVVRTLSDPSRTKNVIRYQTENNSRLLDLGEFDDQFCPISSKDLQELINYYYEKYGRPKAESV